MTAPWPSYQELTQRRDAPPGSSWGLFGADDDVGTVNFIDADAVRRGAACVRSGKRFRLDHDLGAFQPQLARTRRNPTHHIFSSNPNHRDDYIAPLYLQATSQIDGLRHVRHPEFGFYNGIPDEDVVVGNGRGGINRWADVAICTRGVLLDVAARAEREGWPLDHQRGDPITVPMLSQTATAQGVTFQPGDALLIRTGWETHYFSSPPRDPDVEPDEPRNAGLDQSYAMAEFLWDNRLSLVAADNIALERLPVPPDSPFRIGDGTFQDGMLHRVIIPLLGFAVGELWALDALASDCRSDGVYDFLLTATPLKLIGGVGSPANAIAVK